MKSSTGPSDTSNSCQNILGSPPQRTLAPQNIGDTFLQSALFRWCKFGCPLWIKLRFVRPIQFAFLQGDPSLGVVFATFFPFQEQNATTTQKLSLSHLCVNCTSLRSRRWFRCLDTSQKTEKWHGNYLAKKYAKCHAMQKTSRWEWRPQTSHLGFVPNLLRASKKRSCDEHPPRKIDGWPQWRQYTVTIQHVTGTYKCFHNWNAEENNLEGSKIKSSQTKRSCVNWHLQSDAQRPIVSRQLLWFLWFSFWSGDNQRTQQRRFSQQMQGEIPAFSLCWHFGEENCPKKNENYNVSWIKIPTSDPRKA